MPRRGFSIWALYGWGLCAAIQLALYVTLGLLPIRAFDNVVLGPLALWAFGWLPFVLFSSALPGAIVTFLFIRRTDRSFRRWSYEQAVTPWES
ncbi:hypothetical protein FLP10_04760 [Agromyces intestinalis]|uniref:Uncharacterized protein n=1 Tax=Agromyces intestinalis TaxID=2592652 RepID=A0A5C1YE56_9MICO|nr:hypothetical protein [Agromyces intestinalis]QEO13810.1 hypothetical protein FLP10_04760 [Agromyces intestinalis]